MSPRKADAAPVVIETPPAPEPAVQPSALAALHRLLRSVEERLVLRLELVRSRLRDTAPTLEAELVQARTILLQRPGYESAALASRAALGLSAVSDLADTLTDARLAREEGLALVARVVEQLGSLQVADMRQLEHRDTMQSALVPVKVCLSNLIALLDRAAPLLSLGRVCAGRSAQAALTVAREWRVENLRRRITMHRLAIEAARDTSADDAELAAIVQACARQLETQLPCPSIAWPKSGDPFALPTLQD